MLTLPHLRKSIKLVTMNAIIGNNLKKLREANKFTQEQAASYVGINRTTYANYEAGERTAPLDILEKLSNLYGNDLDFMFEENQEVTNRMLACSFRVEVLSPSDLKEVAEFKEIVKNYLKMDILLAQCQK